MANATTFNRILSKGIESELPKVVDGRLRFTTDTGRLFLDNGNERVEISDFVKGQTSTQITGTLAPLPKFYLASDTNVLYFYAGGQWNTVKAANASTADYSNNASTANYAKNAINTITRSGNTFTVTRFDGTTFTFSQQNSTYTNGEGLSLSNGTFSINKNASTVAYATKAGSASSATNATNAGSATNAGTANFASTAANGIENITRSGKTFTVTRQDGSTFTFDQQDDNQTYKAGEGLSLNTGTFSINKDASTVKYATQAGSAANATCATNSSSVGGFTVGKSVPSNAVFTDTKYAAGSGLALNSGTFSIDPDASTVAYATNSGTATYATNAGNADNATCATNASSVNGFTVGVSVPANAKFTDNDTKNTAGATNTSSKIFLVGATSQGANPQTYTHDTAYVSTDGYLYSGGNKVLTTSEKGAASGVAELDSAGKVPSSQLPSFVDDVIEGYYYNSKFYEDSAHTTEITPESGKIYVDLSTDKTYRWSGTAYTQIKGDLALGETSTTAYRGDRGKIAYDHSQSAHAPSNAQPNQNAFSNVKVGSTTIAADTTTDTLEIAAGTNVTITPDATNDKLTITATDTTYSAATGGGLSLSNGAFSINKDASTVKYADNATCATNASSVGGFTVGKSVPSNAVFTDTKYAAGTGLSLNSGTFNIDSTASTVAYATNSGTATYATNAGSADNAASAANATCATNASSVGGFTVGVSVPANAKFTDTTYATFSTASNGLVKASGSGGAAKFLKGDNTWGTPTDTKYAAGTGLSLNSGTFSIDSTASTVAYATNAGSADNATCATNSSSVGGFTVGVSVPANAKFTDTTYAVVSTTANGLAPKVTDTSKFLKGDGTWATPTNTTYSAASGGGLTLSSGAFSINKDASTVKYATNSGTAIYATSAGSADNATCATNSSSVGGFTVGKSVPSNAVFTDTTYATFSTAANGLVPKPTNATTAQFLRGNGTWATPTNTTYSDMTTAEFDTGTSTTTRVLSPKRLKEIFGLATASSATNASTAEYAINAGSASNADNATCATNASSVGGFTVGKSVPSNAVFTDTTYANVTSAAAGLAPAGGSGTTKYLRQDGSWQVPPNTTYGNVTSATAGLAPAGGSGTTKYLRQDGSWQVPPDNNTTYGNATTATAGLLPTLAGGTEKYLRADGTWVKPPNDNTTYANVTSATAGLAPAGGSGTTKYLRQDGSWQVPPNDNTTYDLSAYVNNVTTSGSGNAITGFTKSGNTLTLKKDTTFPTSNTTYADMTTAEYDTGTSTTTRVLSPKRLKEIFGMSTASSATNSSTAEYAINAGSATNASSVGGFTVGKSVPSNANFNDTTYSAGTGISISSAKAISLATTGTAGTYGPTADVTGSNNTTIAVPQITTDSYGRVTGATTFKYTSKNTSYSGMTTAEFNAGTLTTTRVISPKILKDIFGMATASSATNAASAGYATLAGNATCATNSSTAEYATNAGSATNAASVGGHTVAVNVPSNAVFTDTTYSAASGGGLSLSGTAFSINKDASTVKYATSAGSATNANNATCATNASSVSGFTVGVSVPANAKFTDTTYAVVSTTANGLAPKVTDTSKFLKGDGTWATPTNTTYANATTAAAGLLPILAGGTEKYLRADGTWVKPPNDNTTYGNMTSAAAGLAPAGGSGTTKYLRQDGTWQVPPNDNTKNTAGSTDTSSKIFLIGATSQGANPQTYSHDTAYVGTDGCLYSGGNKVLTAETDPTVPSWAKASSKPTYTASEVGALSTTVKGVANGVAELDSAGKVPSSQLPSFVDDVIEGYYYNSKFYKESTHTTEITGESGKIYVNLESGSDQNKTYRWSGSAYVVISETLALGETSSTAYRGDRGKIAYDHSQAAHAPSNAQPNQNAFSNVKVGSTTIAADTTTDTLELVASGGITLTPDATNDKLTISSTTYGNMTSAAAGLAPAGGSGTTKYLRQDGTWVKPPNDNTTYANVTSATAGLAPAGGSGTTKYLRQDGSWQVPPNDNTTYGNMTSAAAGLAPAGGSGTTKYLRQDGSWQVPPNDNTTYGNMTSAAAGLAPAGGSGTTKYLRQDGSWQVPPNDNTTYGVVSTAANGLAPKVTNTSGFLKGDGTWATPTNTTYAVVSTTANGLAPKVTDTSKFLKGDGTWATPANTTYGNMTSAAAGLAPAGGSGTTKYLRQDGSWQVPPNDNTTYGNMTSAAAGLAPAGGSGTTKYLRQDGSWQVPPNDNTTYGTFSTAANGLVPKPASAATTSYLNSSGTWTTPVGTTYSAGTGISISTAKAISLATTGTAGTYGPSANVTGNEGATISVPQITTDSYGRVTSVTNRTYTSKNTTYDLSAATVNTSTYSNRPMVEADFDFGELNSTTPGDESYNS